MFLQEVSFPGISIGVAEQPARTLPFMHPGERIVYEPLVCSFLVDKNLKNYKEVINWMKRITTTAGSSQDDEYENPVLSMGINSVRFYNAFPIAITGLQFKANEEGMTYLTSSVTFKYDFYEFV